MTPIASGQHITSVHSLCFREFAWQRQESVIVGLGSNVRSLKAVNSRFQDLENAFVGPVEFT
jgi:hypothetical protein